MFGVSTLDLLVSAPVSASCLCLHKLWGSFLGQTQTLAVCLCNAKHKRVQRPPRKLLVVNSPLGLQPTQSEFRILASL